MFNPNCGVYVITSPSGKAYIGSSTHIPRRFATHRHMLLTGRHHCAGLRRACDKYGLPALIFRQIAICPRDKLAKFEQEQITERPRAELYNSRLTAQSNQGLSVRDEVRKRISEAHKGKKHTELHKTNVAAAKRKQTPETLAKISAALLGRKIAPEIVAKVAKTLTGRKMPDAVRAKIRAKNLGQTRSAETCAKLAAARTGKKHSEATLAKLRVPCSPEKRAKIAAARLAQNAIRRANKEPT